MKVKIDVSDLRVGMYVCELDRPWRETPFLFQGFRVRSPAEIEELKRYCEYVFITDHRRDDSARDKKIEFEILKASAPRPAQQLTYMDLATLDEELEPARQRYAHTHALVDSLMRDARLGKSLDAEGVKLAVSGVLASVLRNPDAMLCLNQIKRRDEYTATHCLRVCVLALAFGRHLGLPEEALNVLGIGALLHDIGKARVPEDLLNKPGRLSAREFDVVKLHVPLGVKMVDGLEGIPPVSVQVMALHHERHDGSGYAEGLRGSQIDQLGMIAAIVDYYDALTSDRPYRDAMAAHTVLKQMYVARGGPFPSGLVEHFIQCMGIYPIGSLVELNTGQVGVVVAHNRQRALRPRLLLVLDQAKHPYRFPHYIDLAKQPRDQSGVAWEIKMVLEPGTYGVNPVDYMPTHPHQAFGTLG